MAGTSDLDNWIEQLYTCKALTEIEIKILRFIWHAVTLVIFLQKLLTIACDTGELNTSNLFNFELVLVLLK